MNNQETVHEAKKTYDVFIKNIDISLSSNLPLARWAYFGAEESHRCFCELVDEAPLDFLIVNMTDMNSKLIETKTLLKSRFSDNKYLMEQLR